MVALVDLVITEHGGQKVIVDGQPVYHLHLERPANLEPLPDRQQEPMLLRSQYRHEIERAIVKGEPESLARAAYLAICLDMAADLRQEHPEQWTKALAALQSQPKVMQTLFFESPIPAGDALRAKAVAAGLVQPEQKIRLWTP
jgi:hypothetical protein